MSEMVPVAAPDPILVTIGDISFSAHWLITPVGTKPIQGTQILVTDYSQTQTRIPGWAIVLAVIGALFFLLGLLFLLVKETVTVGSVQVTVHNDGLVHATQMPVTSQHQVIDMQARANFARQLIATAAR